eukprot:CAMPEP_0179300716 /NCGR_PEP_ID=MMETSP0797-20121207/47181_1 /TAXON_ID=47934 /ORGANISM="Dinophysis acuminata, Strain DAEP01" /LENGTH=144 /DNA_ID=CAMNT_0021010201 /DNA_START=73 /DNA_END=507 /DNA_ORIENTATION=+
MAPVECSADVKATPQTIWRNCFEHMAWERWDPDLKEVKDASGGCENGATCVFAMKDGLDIQMTLSNVEKNKSLDFSGGAYRGTVRCVGKIVITPVDAASSKIDYSFELFGCFGSLVALLNNKAVVGGTETGLANMVKLSEDATE